MNQFFVRSARLLLPCIIALVLTGSFTWYLGSNLLKAEEMPFSDFAADLLLERKIDDQGYLLTGHYSRFEFNHPGPFFFYAYHAAHRVLDTWGLPPSASAYAATMVLNIIFLVIGILLAHRAARVDAGFWSLLCSVLIVFSMFDHGVHSIWMPFKIIAPFFAFQFSLILIARREFQYVPLASFLVSVLIHGYLSMVVLVLPAFFVALIIGWRQHDPRITKTEIRYLAGGLLVAAIFALPIVIDTLFSDASNVGKILEYSHQKIHSPRLAQILASMDENAFHGLGIIQLTLLLAGIYLFGADRESVKIGKSGLLVALLLTLVFVVYHKFVPRPMFNNMVLFMQAVPMALVTLCVVSFFRAGEHVGQQHILHRPALIAGLVLVTYAAAMNLRPAAPNTDISLRHLANTVMLATAASGGARIDYTEHNQWPTVAGLLFELKQRGFPACTTWRTMDFLYTPQQICAPDSAATVILIPESQCNGRCIVAVYGTGIMLPPPPG